MAKNGMPHQTLAMIGPQMARSGSPRMLTGSGSRPRAYEPVRQRADDRVEQPGPGEAGQEGRHRPGQEDERLERAARPGNGVFEQQREDQAEDELEEQRAEGPDQRVVAARSRTSGRSRARRKLSRPTQPPANGLQELSSTGTSRRCRRPAGPASPARSGSAPGRGRDRARPAWRPVQRALVRPGLPRAPIARLAPDHCLACHLP